MEKESERIKKLEEEIEMLKKAPGPAHDLTVLMPTYNGADTIMKALSALPHQGLRLRVVILDNESEDGTFELITSAIEKKWFKMDVEIQKLKRIAGGSKENKCNIRTALAKLAKSKFVFWLDDDILLPPYALRNMYDEMVNNPTWGVFAVQYQVYSPHIPVGATMMPTEVAQMITWTCDIGQPCECNNALEQIKAMGLIPTYYKNAGGIDLSLIR